MSNEAVVAVAPIVDGGDTGPARNRRQQETFCKVLAAGLQMLRQTSYADLSVRAVAARAQHPSMVGWSTDPRPLRVALSASNMSSLSWGIATPRSA